MVPMYLCCVKKGLKYVFSGLLIWVLILSVNWVSYSISDNAIKLRGDLSLTVNQADLPFSGLDSNETKSVSFSQRSINENKQHDFQLFDFSFNFSSLLFSAKITPIPWVPSSNFMTHGAPPIVSIRLSMSLG